MTVGTVEAWGLGGGGDTIGGTENIYKLYMRPMTPLQKPVAACPRIQNLPNTLPEHVAKNVACCN